jgi:hypothetical protein
LMIGMIIDRCSVFGGAMCYTSSGRHAWKPESRSVWKHGRSAIA